VLVVDDRMSGMTGLEVVRQIRRDARFNGLFVIVWSADGECRPGALAEGADDFWIKGSPEIIAAIERIEETLRNRRA
jgi:CheY-like chemotaxis protein